MTLGEEVALDSDEDEESEEGELEGMEPKSAQEVESSLFPRRVSDVGLGKEQIKKWFKVHNLKKINKGTDLKLCGRKRGVAVSSRCTPSTIAPSSPSRNGGLPLPPHYTKTKDSHESA
jgi:hypothetical protein